LIDTSRLGWGNAKGVLPPLLIGGLGPQRKFNINGMTSGTRTTKKSKISGDGETFNERGTVWEKKRGQKDGNRENK